MSRFNWRQRGPFGTLRLMALAAVAVAVTVLVLRPAGTSAKVNLKAVATTDQNAPGTTLKFDAPESIPGLDEPMVNNSGDVAFISSFGNAAGNGVFLSHEGTLSTIAKTGQSTSGSTFGGGGNTNDQAFDGPAINNDRTVAFSARNMTGAFTSALFKKPRDGSLSVVARQGDNAPGGGKFTEFDDLAVNNGGDIAFIARYDDGGIKSGVFLKPKDGGVRAIVRAGQELPNTDDGKLCDLDTTTSTSNPQNSVDGPSLNDQRVVAFQVGCFVGGKPGLEGSVFTRKNNEPIRSLLKIGDHSPVGGDITAIKMSRPGINSTDAVFLLDTVDSPSHVIATKKLGDGDIKVCAKNGQDAPSPLKGELTLANGAPSIDEDGDIAIAAEAETSLVDDEATNDITDEAIFTCRDGNVKTIASYGGAKPAGKNNTFGSLEEPSIAEDHVVFLDESNNPMGVFVSGND